MIPMRALSSEARTLRRRRAPVGRLLRLALVFAIALVPAAGANALGAGDEAPTFSLPSLDGKQKISLAGYRGKVVWLDFWASWCSPCLTSLPELEALRQQLPPDRFQIVAVNLDQDPAKARKFLARSPVGYPSAHDPKGQLPERFGLETMPTSYLIDQKGVIRMVHEGFRKGDIETIRAEVEKLVKGRP
jgi:peroxiredoxin